LTIAELIAEQRRRLASGNAVERFAAAILIPAVLAERVAGLADRQLGQLLLDEVWPSLTPLAPESTICLHVADRLRGSPKEKCPTCPKCGSESLLRFGIDEPDRFECVLLKCGHNWLVASDNNTPGSWSGGEEPNE
jgi:hypothetical protein